MIYINFLLIAIGFVALFKFADYFLKGAIGIANIFDIPKMIVGIVLVGLATTAPEFGVSVISAILGDSEIALGNAVGSVIIDDGVALALAAILSPTVIIVNCRLIKIIGLFLLSVDVFAYILARNGTIGRLEGVIFIFILILYFVVIIKSQKKRNDLESEKAEKYKINHLQKKAMVRKHIKLFLFGFIGIIISSRLVHWTTINVCDHFSLSKTLIGSTIIALGTSLPEVSTCITAALKGEGEIAVGDIIGADVLNVLWIIGASAIANPITVELNIIHFIFPFMIIIVAVMLGSMIIGCRLTKTNGIILLLLYLVYLFMSYKIFV